MLRLEPYTPEEEEAIEKLKNRTIHELSPRLLQDQTLYYRFLKARDFNLKQAEAMLLKHVSDRKIYETDNSLTTYRPPEHMEEIYPDSLIGFDKEGYVVRYCDLGNVDVRGFYSLFDFKQLVQFKVRQFERDIDLMTEKSKMLGKSITQIVFIFNMENLSLLHATHKKGIEILLEGFKLYQDNYPERIKNIYIINSSFYFNLIFSIIKTIVAGPLLQKIRFFGKDGWRETLLEVIDADELPAFLGGNKTDPDGNPLCNTFVVHSKKIPEEFYKKKFRRSLSQKNDAKKLTVNRFSSSKITLDVDEPDTQIEWEFETKTRDIGFALYYQDDSEIDIRLVELIPKQRIDTGISAEAGLFKCSKKGTYVMEFDNSYSWIYSKELYYRVKVIKPKQHLYTFN